MEDNFLLKFKDQVIFTSHAINYTLSKTIHF